MPRKSRLPKGYVSFYQNGASTLLRLPQEFASMISSDQVWRIETPDEGILLRLVDKDEIQLSKPRWAQGDQS